MNLDAIRQRFEEAALAYFILRRAMGKAHDDNGSPATREALFWRKPGGEYGVRHFNSAWWGWRSAAPVWREFTLVEGRPDESAAPFDGKAVLIKTRVGVVEAWWQKRERVPLFDDPENVEGHCWVCYDAAFLAELEEALAWMPLP